MENKDMFYKANVRYFLRIKKQFSDKYIMRRIKSFSAISESASDRIIYKANLGGYGNKGRATLVDLYKEPKDLYMASIIGGSAEWTLDLQHRNWGVELGSDQAQLVSLRLELEVDNPETGEPEEVQLEYAETEFSPEMVRTEIHQFPLDLEAIEITMNGSTDPKLWNIVLHVGRVSEY
jgi:hypothetical protein